MEPWAFDALHIARQRFLLVEHFLCGLLRLVVAAGLAAFPYSVYYRPAFRQAAEAEPEKIANSQWVIIAFPSRTLRRYPELAGALDREFEAPVRFKGTLGDGAILVYRRKAG